VMLVSCGAEEVIQGGIYSFAEKHVPSLDRDKTWVLTLECLGSPRLAMLEGEGTIMMEDYYDLRFRDLVAQIAHREGIPMRRGMRARSSTDAVVPSRAGYPTATLVSLDRYKAISNYHLHSDVPENLTYTTIQQALELTEAVARELATNRWL
jgi:Zn-dependent M28 family amino/carboxypeptidase